MSDVKVLANLLLKGSLEFSNNLSEFPSNPKDGMVVMKDYTLWSYTMLQGVRSWYPLTEPRSFHVHTQGIDSDVWVVNHNLNTLDVIVATYDNDNNIIHLALDGSQSTPNQIVLQASGPVSGRVVVIGKTGVAGVAENYRPYDIPLYLKDAPATNATIFKMLVGSGRRFRLNMSDILAQCIVAGATVTLLQVKKNGTVVADVSFNSGSTNGTISNVMESSLEFNSGDTFEVASTSSVGASIAGIMITITGYLTP